MAADAAIAEITTLIAGVRSVSTVELLLHGEDQSAWPVLREAGQRGLATRMGLEDVLTLPSGAPAANNRQLLEVAGEVLARAHLGR